jgi:hypothetical protein
MPEGDRVPPIRLTAVLGFVVAVACAVAATSWAAARVEDLSVANSPDSTVRYSRDIRPILADRCFHCHGMDEGSRKAKLRLDERESAIQPRKGTAAIVPGDLDASELWHRITSHEPDEQMPPPDANKKPLSESQLELIATWIEQGALYEPHWAFVPPTKHAPPPTRDASWPRDDLDRFVLSNLEAHGTTPSPEADRATLLRRLHLDLTGLPPTLEELDAFVADKSPDAYERRVEAIFTTEPYRTRLAERLTAPWLDAARYADTSGIHTDNGRQMWLWRDWVLNAFHSNMPFDRFLTEQIAGDLIPEATIAQKIASGFNRNHVTTDEGGAIPEEYLVEYAIDRVSTTSEVFLGLTMGCARCHDHKYDPITQKDFYSLYAYFNSIDEPGLYSQTPDANRAYEPFLEVPTAAQAASLADLDARMVTLKARLSEAIPNEAERLSAFIADTQAQSGVAWTRPAVLSATSNSPKTSLAIEPDGTIRPSGEVPETEDTTYVVKTSAQDQRLLLLEVLAEKDQRPGRSGNGNAVITGITLEQRAIGSSDSVAPHSDGFQSVPLRWAWASHAQQNGDYEATNVLTANDGSGWALDGHRIAGGRLLMLMTDTPFGSIDGAGAELRITVQCRSEYPHHVIGAVRFSTSGLRDAGIPALPVALSRWQSIGPFGTTATGSLYDLAYGPEFVRTINPAQKFSDAARTWTFDERFVDEVAVSLPDVVGVYYLGRTIFSPDARSLDVTLGTDDGFQLYVNGAAVAERRIDRGVRPDEDRATISLKPGLNTLVLKVVNTGGQSGYQFRPVHAEGSLPGVLTTALIPAESRSASQSEALTTAWRRAFSKEYRETQESLDAAIRERETILATVPRTMIMKELETPRETFVLKRGQYDQPDKARPVSRDVPQALGRLPSDAPADRRGLASWMVSPDNPLTARVAVNRLWETVFGSGLVRTSEDFGLQGEWPTHPELLDTLAVDFRESGWDVHRLLKRFVLSSTYRQASRVRTDLRDRDPENRWLSYFPRRRLPAEQVRDVALFASGLLVEKLGGPSVKTPQPDGLWKEVALPASNTQDFQVGTGEDLYRRSLYTYWKRAVPPPALMTLDAPTRESCVVRRLTTNTPLQALALWNEPQFVEAARALARRTLADAQLSSDEARLTSIFRRCTGRIPDADDLVTLSAALANFRARYREDPQAAASLAASDPSSMPISQANPELAAWTLIAGGIMSLHETITHD